LPNSPRPKQRVKFAAVSSPYWSLSTFKALSTRNSCPLVKPWQILLWGFEAAVGGHSAHTSRQVKEQLVSPPWQRARLHITRCSTIPNFQKHYSDSPPPPIHLTAPPATFSYSPRWN
jgi:hypothetical protein